MEITIYLLVTYGFSCIGFIGLWLGLEIKKSEVK